MSHSNRDDIETSLNASTLLIDLIDQESRGTASTMEILTENEGEVLGKIVKLALDPSNSFNQPYLLSVLLAFAKSLKPNTNNQNLFKDLDDNEEDSDSSAKKGPSPQAQNFDLKTATSRNLVAFLNVAQNNQLFYNLLLIINVGDLDSSQSTYMNQQNAVIKRIGLTRLKSLELIELILSLLHPSLGKLAQAEVALMSGGNVPQDEVEHYEPIHMKKYLSEGLRRQLLKTVLLVTREYGYCSIAC